MEWIPLNDISQLETLKSCSDENPVLIFKHSTRCSISSMALNRLERSWKKDEMSGMKTYYLDLIAHRNVSNAVADSFGVPHESPQALVIDKGNCVHHSSHSGISYQEIQKFA